MTTQSEIPTAPESHNPDSGAPARPRRRSWIDWIGSTVVLAAALPVLVGGLVSFSAVESTSLQPALSPGDLVVGIAQRAYEEDETVVYRGLEAVDVRGMGRIVAIEENEGARVYAVAADESVAILHDDVIGRVVLRLPGAGFLLHPVAVVVELLALASLATVIALRLGRAARR